MFKNPFKSFTKWEWILWSVSLIVTLTSNIMCGNIDAITLIATSMGVTALILAARGDVWGQILSVIFGILYAVVSYRFRYYGEMITYVGMSVPIAAMSVITWLKHPFREDRNEVEIHRLTKTQKVIMVVSAILVTWVFYYILKFFDTPNLLTSTVSVTTSYVACFLLMMRNSYYAVAYAANDIVLIALWIMATIESFEYFPMIICFVMFLVNDLYGFISWKIREGLQAKKNAE
ncbi:MAG: nicotinamide mononucleotide transporter [Ruminococcaceae bacterium]|nr:nicotinamide mononucleotide transporter [Oscillospiraceae bacterium]